MDIWLILYALVFLFAIPRIKWHSKPRVVFEIKIADPTQTRYFRSDQHTINGLTAYKLLTTQSTTSAFFSKQKSGNWQGQGRISHDVVIRTSGGSETTVGSKIGEVDPPEAAYGYASGSWACPETNMSTTDSVVVRVYARNTSSDPWTLMREFTTEQLGSYQLSSAMWTFTWYCWDTYVSPTSYVNAYFGTSSYNSRIDNFTWSSIPPVGTPTNCSVSILSETSLRVSWTDASTDEDDFHVERKTGAGGTYGEVQIITSTTKTTTGTVYTWDNSGLLIYTTYYYRVRAHRHSDNIYSNYSNEAYATTPFYAPTNLVAISLNIDAILVQWVDNSQNESDYHLERKTSLEPTWAERTIQPANSTQFTDPGLDPAIIYTYRVRAHNHAQDIYTTYSNEASEAPKLLAQIPFNPFTPLLGYY